MFLALSVDRMLAGGEEWNLISESGMKEQHEVFGEKTVCSGSPLLSAPNGRNLA